MLIRLIYASSAKMNFSEGKLMQILGKSRHYNTEFNISGLLLYARGNFFQILEGEEEEVKSLFNKIEKDDRHCNVVTLDQSPITKRAFPEWSMGFRNLESFDKAELRGYSQVLDRKLSPDQFGEMGRDIIYLIEQFQSVG